MKNCPSCGRTNPDTAMYCESCGSSLSPGTNENPNTPAKKSKKRVFAIAGGAAAVLVIVGLVFLIMSLMGASGTLTRAMRKTASAFEQQFGSVQNFRTFSERTTAISSSPISKQDFSIGVPDLRNLTISFDSLTDINQQLSNTDLSIELDSKPLLDATFSVGSTDISLFSEQISPNTILQLSYDEIASIMEPEEGGSYTAEDINPWNSIHPEENKAAAEQAQQLKKDFYSLILSGELQELKEDPAAPTPRTNYLLVLGQEKRAEFGSQLEELLDALSNVYTQGYFDSLAQLKDYASWNEYRKAILDSLSCLDNLTVAIDKNGYLVSVAFDAEGHRKEFSLNGLENPWESFCIYEDGAAVLSGTMTSGSLTFINSDDQTITLVYNDSTSEFTITDDTSTNISGSFQSTEDGTELNFALESSATHVDFHMAMAKASETPEVLKAEKVVLPSELTPQKVALMILDNPALRDVLNQILNAFSGN